MNSPTLIRDREGEDKGEGRTTVTLTDQLQKREQVMFAEPT